MKKKKALTTKEIFCGMPRLYVYFREMDSTIKKFSPTDGKSEGIEELKIRRRELLKVAKGMDRIDLQILYYLHRLQRLRPMQLLCALKKLFAAQGELADLIKEEP